MCPATGRLFVCRNKRFETSVPFHAVKKKKKKSDKQHNRVFSLVYFDKMNEAGKFLVLTDCIMT